MGYGAGYYYVISNEEAKAAWAQASQHFADVVVEVDASQVSAPASNNNSYGVGCRIQPDGNGYFLLISGDGYYGIFRTVQAGYEPLVEWTESDVIRRRNATNHIQVICNGTTLALLVNGQLMATAHDDLFTEGDIALQATTFEDETTEVHFNNLLAKEPRTTYLPLTMHEVSP